MGQFIVKLKDGEQDVLLMWSTVVDAPTYVFEDEAELEEWIRFRYGKDGVDELPARMARVHAKGTSSLNDGSAEEVVSFNRAGKDETCLTIEQIIDFYWRKKSEGEAPLGRDFQSDDDDATIPQPEDTSTL